MDLPAEILIGIVDQLDLKDICNLRLVCRSWKININDYDTLLFKRRCDDKLYDGPVPPIYPQFAPYLNKLCYMAAAIEKCLDASSMISGEQEKEWIPDELLRDTFKQGSTLLTWRFGELELASSGFNGRAGYIERDGRSFELIGRAGYIVRDGRIPIFVLEAGVPREYTRHDSDMLKKRGSIDLRSWTIECTDLSPTYTPETLDKALIEIQNKVTEIPTTWGKISLISGRSSSDEMQVTATNSAGKLLHEWNCSEGVVGYSYTSNHMLILAKGRGVGRHISWYNFSSDGTQVSEEFDVQTRSIITDGSQERCVQFTHSHLLITSHRFVYDDRFPNVKLYTCSYQSMRSSGEIVPKLLANVCERSLHWWSGPYTTGILPQYIVYHGYTNEHFEKNNILWCMDLLKREIFTYRYKANEIAYLTPDCRFFSLSKEKMSKLFDQYEYTVKQQCLPAGTPIPLAELGQPAGTPIPLVE